jgi:hypothetical protein
VDVVVVDIYTPINMYGHLMHKSEKIQQFNLQDQGH